MNGCWNKKNSISWRKIKHAGSLLTQFKGEGLSYSIVTTTEIMEHYFKTEIVRKPMPWGHQLVLNQKIKNQFSSRKKYNVLGSRGNRVHSSLREPLRRNAGKKA